MNNIFKVVWYSVLGNSVVASECAKSKSVLAKKIVLVGTGLALMEFSYAQGCSFGNTNILNNTTCEQAIVLENASGQYAVNNLIIDAQKAHNGDHWVKEGALALINTTSNQGITLDVNELTLKNGRSAAGVYLALRDHAEGDLELNFTGKNTVDLFNGSDTLIILENFSDKGGNAVITVAQDAILNVVNKGKHGGVQSGIADALEVNSHYGDAKINFLGQGTIETNNGNAIFARVMEGSGRVLINLDNSNINITVKNNQNFLKPHEEGVHGVSAAINKSGDLNSNITINSLATISISGNGIGIFAKNEGKGQTTINNDGKITSDSYGIYLMQEKSTELALLANNAEVIATTGKSGIFFETNGQGILNFGAQSKIQGGSESGVFLSKGKNILTNAGKISAQNDLAIKSTSRDDSSVVNSGTIIGRIVADSKMNFINAKSGVFELRHVENDIKNVAVSDFSGGNIDNQGTIKFASATVQDTNPVGELTVPAVNNISISQTGVSQAHLMGVAEFKHSGIIDLRGEGKSGNILKISGQSGSLGTFITNGGEIYLTTTLNKGAEDSRSDMLILDNVKKGSDASKIYITKIEESSVKTEAHGIRLIQTLGTQDNNAFELGGAVTYGLYEYKLAAIDTNTKGEQGFYLVNYIPKAPIEPGKPVDPLDSNGLIGQNGPVELLKSPVVGAYLGMQYATANMFNQNILDRRDNVREPDETVWGRIQYNEAKTKHMSNTQSLKIENTLIQLGWDLYQDQNEERGKVFGIYAGYGHSDVKNRSLQTGTSAKGIVDGYQLGAYYSWFKQDDVGPYIDMWGHLAKYRNKFKGATYGDQASSDSTSYNGHGFSVSIEAGHGFIVGQSDDNNTSWVLEPHAQVTYHYIKMKNMVDSTGTRFNNNKAKGFDTRLGARFYGYRDNNDSLRPYVEVNWLHNGMDNAIHVNGIKESNHIGRNIWELKVGAQGHVSKDISIFAHVGYQKGKNKFKNTELQIGFNYNF